MRGTYYKILNLKNKSTNYNDSKRKMWEQREGKVLFIEEHQLIRVGGMIENHYFAITVITTKEIMPNNGLRFFKNVNVMKDQKNKQTKKNTSGELFWIKREQKDIRDT